MQAIVTPRLRWTGLAILTLHLPLATLAAQAERYSIPGGDVAIYNLAGEVKVEPGSGVVTAELTRGGADAVKLKVLQGEVDGWEALRVIYPADRIQYGRLSDGSSTQLRVRENGTFGDEHDGEGKQRGKRISITGKGGGLDAYADLRVTVPPGKRVAIYLAVGKISVTNVDGDLWLNASAAPVTTSGTRGELNVDVGSGAVQVSEARGELSVDTGSGLVSVSGVRGEKISIDTGSGDVTASDVRSNELSVETGSGDIQVTGLVAPQVALETGSGSVAADVQGRGLERERADRLGRCDPEAAAGARRRSGHRDVQRRHRDRLLGVGDPSRAGSPDRQDRRWAGKDCDRDRVGRDQLLKAVSGTGRPIEKEYRERPQAAWRSGTSRLRIAGPSPRLGVKVTVNPLRPLTRLPPYPERFEIPGPLGHPVVQDTERLGRSGQETAARLAAGPALHFHHGHQVPGYPSQKIGQQSAAQVTRRVLAVPIVRGLGPLDRVEREHRAQRRRGEPTPPLLGKEVGQRFSEILEIQVGRLGDAPGAGQPPAEQRIELLAAGESGFLQIGGGLESGVALERGAELMDHPATEPEPGTRRGDVRSGHGRKGERLEVR